MRLKNISLKFFVEAFVKMGSLIKNTVIRPFAFLMLLLYKSTAQKKATLQQFDCNAQKIGVLHCKMCDAT